MGIMKGKVLYGIRKLGVWLLESIHGKRAILVGWATMELSMVPGNPRMFPGVAYILVIDS